LEKIVSKRACDAFNRPSLLRLLEIAQVGGGWSFLADISRPSELIK
jgi:hypothetical protein